jgi:hypothetical protein
LLPIGGSGGQGEHVTPPASEFPSPVLVPARFNGPPTSGNGGYSAGRFAAAALPEGFGRAVEVTLRRPVPMDVPMQVTAGDDGWTMADADGPVGEAREVDDAVDPIEPVSYDVAEAATSRYPGFVEHPFPSCFSCGPGREDGLRIFPGTVEPLDDGLKRMAAPWTPDATLRDDLWSATWAALDCIGGWAGDLEERPMLLGRMTGVVHALPRVGEPHVVLGQGLGTDGRKTMTAATLVDSDGRVVARARHTWIAISAEDLARLTR